MNIKGVSCRLNFDYILKMKIKCVSCKLNFDYIAFCETCELPSLCDNCIKPRVHIQKKMSI